MDIEINEVHEIIKNLESCGELSIKEEKYLKVAKLCVQLATENVALKSKGKELLGEACAVYSRINKLIDPSIGDFVDGQTLHEFQFVLDAETPATDAYLSGIKADGVEQYAALFADTVNMEREHNQQFHKGTLWFARQLRDGANHD